MGHRKQQSSNRRLENSFFFQVYLISVQPETSASPHRYFTSSWAAVVTLASGQRTSVVASYQNHASPQPRTAVSHWSFVSVSSAIKYTNPERVFWLSQDIVHTLTSRVAIAVYNCTTIKFTSKNKKCLRARGTPLRLKDERRSKSGNRPRTRQALLHRIYMIFKSYARNKSSNKHFNNKKQLYKGCLGSKKGSQASLPWASSLGKACSNNGQWMAQSLGDSEDPEDRLHLTKAISLGKMSEIRISYVVRGLLLAVALAIRGDFTLRL